MARKSVASKTKNLDTTITAKLKPSAHSRPVVISNRPMIAHDPMVTSSPDSKPALPGAPAVHSGKTISRPTQSAGSNNSQPATTETLPDTKPAPTTASQVIAVNAAETPEVSEITKATSDGVIAEDTVAQTTRSIDTVSVASPSSIKPERPAVDSPLVADTATPTTIDKQLLPGEEQTDSQDADRQAQIENLITKGTYVVPIGHDGKTTRRRWLMVLIVLILATLLIVDLLADIGTISAHGLPHTRFFSSSTPARVTLPAGVLTAPSATHPAVSAATVTMAQSSLTTLSTSLLAYHVSKGSYPSDLSSGLLSWVDPSVLRPPNGITYKYIPTPAGCTTDAGDCTGYTLQAVTSTGGNVVASRSNVR